MPKQQTGGFDLSTIEIEAATGKVLSAQKVIDPPPLFRVILQIAALHSGRFGYIFESLCYQLRPIKQREWQVLPTAIARSPIANY